MCATVLLWKPTLGGCVRAQRRPERHRCAAGHPERLEFRGRANPLYSTLLHFNVATTLLCTCCTAECALRPDKPLSQHQLACAQSAQQAGDYRKNWTGEVCRQSQGNPGSNWLGIGCANGRVTDVRLRGGANGSLDGFGQLTGLATLQLDDNQLNGESHSTASTHMCGVEPLPTACCGVLSRLYWPAALPTAPCKAHERYFASTQCRCVSSSLIASLDRAG